MEFLYDYIDNVTQLQIIDDKKQITGKKSIITACNVDYRLKRSGPKQDKKNFSRYFLHLMRYLNCWDNKNLIFEVPGPAQSLMHEQLKK